jgi:hypothetical protein
MALSAIALASACGGASAPAKDATHVGAAEVQPGAAQAHAPKPTLLQWPEFGLTPQRTDSSHASTGITAANVAHLHRMTLTLPGTVDSSPIYLHEAMVGGARHDVIVVTTTYGRTLAIDANSGRTLWTFTPPAYASVAGSAQITTATPIADPDGEFIYSASPDGLIHKLSLKNGSEDREGAWPARVTLEPKHEKIASALNIDGPYLLVVTDGYIGDAPPYQGHVLVIERSNGHVHSVFNTLCANRRELIVPSTCPASDSAIWARASALVEPGGKRIIVGTGNGPYNGTTDFGDSWLELTVPDLKLRQAFTPTNQEELNTDDGDLGTGGPALLSNHLLLVGGKDGLLRVLNLEHMDGHPPSSHHVLGGEVQTLPTPGGGQLITQPAVTHEGTRTTAFVAESSGTAAYGLRGERIHKIWENSNAGTSPILAGGLLYVYDPAEGAINVYEPSSSSPIAKLPGSPGHWNSPIVVDNHVIEPEGDANEHSTTGTLDIFSVR